LYTASLQQNSSRSQFTASPCPRAGLAASSASRARSSPSETSRRTPQAAARWARRRCRRRDAGRQGHRRRPVPGTVRHAAHHAIRHRGARPSPGSSGAAGMRARPAPGARTGVPYRIRAAGRRSHGDDGLFRGEKVRFRHVAEGLRGRHARRQDFLDHDHYRPRPLPLVLDHERQRNHQLDGLAGRQVPARKWRSPSFTRPSGDLRMSAPSGERGGAISARTVVLHPGL